VLGGEVLFKIMGIQKRKIGYLLTFMCDDTKYLAFFDFHCLA
jgi:hypothetical protein